MVQRQTKSASPQRLVTFLETPALFHMLPSSVSESRVPLFLSVLFNVTGSDRNTEEGQLEGFIKHVFADINEN